MSRSTATDSVADHAFNMGCDARIAGKSLKWCPFGRGDGDERSYWIAGWRNVNSLWGTGVYGRWGYQPLPPVEAVR